jgi:hypothetical protein
MGPMKYTFILDMNTNMSNRNNYINVNTINNYTNGTDANGTNTNMSDAATKSSAGKFNW